MHSRHTRVGMINLKQKYKISSNAVRKQIKISFVWEEMHVRNQNQSLKLLYKNAKNLVQSLNFHKHLHSYFQVFYYYDCLCFRVTSFLTHFQRVTLNYKYLYKLIKAALLNEIDSSHCYQMLSRMFACIWKKKHRQCE